MTTSVEKLKVGDVLVKKDNFDSWYPDVIIVKKIYLKQVRLSDTYRVYYICFSSMEGDLSIMRRDLVKHYKLRILAKNVDGDLYA